MLTWIFGVLFVVAGMALVLALTKYETLWGRTQEIAQETVKLAFKVRWLTGEADGLRADVVRLKWENARLRKQLDLYESEVE